MRYHSELRRSDEEIRGEVERALIRDGRLRIADLARVDCESGVVLLHGVVRFLAEKDAAEAIARQTPGVVGVINRMTIATDGAVDDNGLRDQALAALARASDPIGRLGVQLSGGSATLVGRVRDAAEIEHAISIVAEVPGIVEVISKIVVAPDVGEQARDDDASLLGALAKALDDAGLLVHDHQFSVEDGVATLRGRLESRADIPRATIVAQNVPGIRRVRNFLRSSATARRQGGS